MANLLPFGEKIHVQKREQFLANIVLRERNWQKLDKKTSDFGRLSRRFCSHIL